MNTKQAQAESPADDHNLDEIATNAAQGDSSAFATLYQHCNKYVMKVALHVVRRHEDAEDVAQSVWSKLVLRLGQYPREVHFTTWLYRVVTNAAIDHTRRVQARRELPLNAVADADETASQHTGARSHRAATDQELDLLQRLIREELTRALEDLRHKHTLRAQCFELHYLQELRVGEISAQLHLSEGTVKSHLYYSRKCLVENHPVLLDLYFAVEERLGRIRP
jgi:RNA polymerase sigma-70 factor (ECF subfamily)